MPWVTFFADRDDLDALLCYTETGGGLRVMESAPDFNVEPLSDRSPRLILNFVDFRRARSTLL
jgi:hypothetical protein